MSRSRKEISDTRPANLFIFLVGNLQPNAGNEWQLFIMELDGADVLNNWISRP